jgi:hypothetical protein
MRLGTCGVLCILAAWAAIPGALAQSNDHHHEFRGDYYRTWQRPDVGSSCCNARLVRKKRKSETASRRWPNFAAAGGSPSLASKRDGLRSRTTDG